MTPDPQSTLPVAHARPVSGRAPERVAVRAPRPGPVGRRRTSLHRFAEVRGLVGGLRMPHRDLELRAADGTRLAASVLPGPVGAPAVVLAHGFGAHRRKPPYAYLADVLAQVCTVLTVDLRGHGQSGGASTLGEREALDVEAGVAHLRAADHDWVGVVGVSMGGTATAHALARRERSIDGAVMISAPARLHAEPQTAPMRRLHQLWTSPPHRAALRLVAGVRVVEVAGWVSPPHPAELVHAGLPTPLLLIHGADDHFFGHEEWTDAASAGRVPLWVQPEGFGHAEDGFLPAFVEDVARVVRWGAARGSFPSRSEFDEVYA